MPRSPRSRPGCRCSTSAPPPDPSRVLGWPPGQPPEHPTAEKLARVGRVSDALVHRDDDDRIAVLTLDSPANRNALSRRLVADLTAHLAEAGADESLHGVLLRSSHPVFCAGADLKEAATVDMVESARSIIALQRAIADLPVPVVCRLDGAGARRRPGPGRLGRRRGLPRRRDLRPHRGAPRPGGRRDLHPAAGPAQPARGIRLVPHRPVGGCRRGPRAGPGHPRRAGRRGGCRGRRGCSTTCAPAPARAWSRPSGCSTPTSSRPSTSAATRWPGCRGLLFHSAVAQERMAAALRR